MFGTEARATAIQPPAKVENEDQLLIDLRVKLGPFADASRLLHHIRASRGKLHWSVNSYFREALAGALPPSAQLQAASCTSAPPSTTPQEPVCGPASTSTGTGGGSGLSGRPPASSPLHQVPMRGLHSATPAVGAGSPSGGQPCSGLRAIAVAGLQAEGGPARLGALSLSSPAHSGHRLGLPLGGAQQPTAWMCEDFRPKPRAQAVQHACMCGGTEPACGSCAACGSGTHPGSSATAGADARGGCSAPDAAGPPGRSTSGSVSAGAVGLGTLPQALQEEVLSWCTCAWDLAACACACQALRKAAASELLWHALFVSRWGCVVFPVDKPASSGTLAHPPSTSYTPSVLNDQPPTATATNTPGATAGAMQGAAIPSLPPPLSMRSVMRADAQRSTGPPDAHAPVPEGQPMGPPPCGRAEPRSHGSRVCTSTSSSVGPGPTHLASSSEGPAGAGVPSQGFAVTSQGPMGVPQPARGSASWKHCYKEQASYPAAGRCPCCGAHQGVVPIVYGFPSPHLLEGMRQRRLILGGDHLIEDCHCWACTTCNASFRTYPYEQPHLWRADHEAQAVRRAAAAQTGQGQVPGPGEMHAYTYEL